MPRCSSCNQSRWVYARFGRFADELEWLTGFLPYGCLACGRRGWHRSRRTPRAVDELRRACPRLLRVRIPTTWLAPARAVVVRRPGGGWVVAFALGFGSGAFMFSAPTASLPDRPAAELTRVEPASAEPRPVDPKQLETPPVTAARGETAQATPQAAQAPPPRAATRRIEPKAVKRPEVKVAAAREPRVRPKPPAPAAPARRPSPPPAPAAPPVQAAAPPPPAATTASQDRPRFHGILEIHSEPLGALVSVDGRMVGATPLLLKAVPAGSRVLRIESDGYERWSFAARVVANQATRVVATLQRGSGH